MCKMMKLSLCLAGLLLVGSASVAHVDQSEAEGLWVKEEQDARASGRLVKNPDFGFFYFVRQWPGTFCSSHACPLLHDRKNERFTVHGLWPNYNGGGWPQFCDSDKPFDADALDDLMDDLEEVWPSYMNSRDSDGFWAHEWNKHGTCAQSSLPDEHAYFKTILDLNAKYDLEIPLKEAGIVPKEDKKYPAKEFKSVIIDAYGADFDIHCDSHGELTEVWMCFDKELKPMDCPGTGKAASALSEEAQADLQLQYPRCDYILMPPIPGSPERDAEQEEQDEQQEVSVRDKQEEQDEQQKVSLGENQGEQEEQDEQLEVSVGDNQAERGEGEMMTLEVSVVQNQGEQEEQDEQQETSVGEQGEKQEGEMMTLARSETKGDVTPDDEDEHEDHDHDHDAEMMTLSRAEVMDEQAAGSAAVESESSKGEGEVQEVGEKEEGGDGEGGDEQGGDDDDEDAGDEDEDDNDEDEDDGDDDEDDDDNDDDDEDEEEDEEEEDGDDDDDDDDDENDDPEEEDDKVGKPESKASAAAAAASSDSSKSSSSSSSSSESSEEEEEEKKGKPCKHRKHGGDMHRFYGELGTFPKAPFPHAFTCILAMASAIGVTAVILVAAVRAGMKALHNARGRAVRPITSTAGKASGSGTLVAADEAAAVALEEGLDVSQVQGLKQPLLKA